MVEWIRFMGHVILPVQEDHRANGEGPGPWLHQFFRRAPAPWHYRTETRGSCGGEDLAYEKEESIPFDHSCASAEDLHLFPPGSEQAVIQRQGGNKEKILLDPGAAPGLEESKKHGTGPGWPPPWGLASDTSLLAADGGCRMVDGVGGPLPRADGGCRIAGGPDSVAHGHQEIQPETESHFQPSMAGCDNSLTTCGSFMVCSYCEGVPRIQKVEWPKIRASEKARDGRFRSAIRRATSII